MQPLKQGDSIHTDLPDETDPDHEQYHGRTGEIVKIIEDEAGMETGDERDSVIYRVKFDDGQVVDFRRRDLRLI